MEDLTRDVAERYQLWLESPAFDRDTKEELRALTGNNQEITGFTGIWNLGQEGCGEFWVREPTG